MRRSIRGRPRAHRLPDRPRRRAPGRLRPRPRTAHRRRPHQGVPDTADPTDKVPECRPHLERGSHLTLYRFTPNDYQEVVAVFKGTHPETGQELRVEHPAPEGFPWPEQPAEEGVSAPGYAADGIAEIAQKLRRQAGFGDDADSAA